MNDYPAAGQTLMTEPKPQKKDADYVFYELTRSICPECRKVIDAKILLRDNKVYMAKRCPDHGPFEALVYGDAEMYTSFSKYNKPGTIPLAFGTEIKDGCPLDCGLCPDHQQHACLGIHRVRRYFLGVRSCPPWLGRELPVWPTLPVRLNKCVPLGSLYPIEHRRER